MRMNKACVSVFLVLTILLGTAAADDDRVEHFEGKPAETLEEAVANFAEANAEMAGLLEGRLSDQDLVRIHELSYTLENALERISREVDSLAVTLEDIHVASEQMDRETIRTQGSTYLNEAQFLAQ